MGFEQRKASFNQPTTELIISQNQSLKNPTWTEVPSADILEEVEIMIGLRRPPEFVSQHLGNLKDVNFLQNSIVIDNS